MTERAYTVPEIDALRQVCERKYLWGSYDLAPNGRCSRSYMEQDMVVAVEQMVRTFMLAGKTAQDLVDGT